MEGIVTLTGDTADGTGETTETALIHLQITRILEDGHLCAEVTTCAVGNLAQIHEIGTLETVERHHNFQPQFTMQQRIDNGKLKCTHIFIVIVFVFSHNGGTSVRG